MEIKRHAVCHYTTDIQETQTEKDRNIYFKYDLFNHIGVELHLTSLYVHIHLIFIFNFTVLFFVLEWECMYVSIYFYILANLSAYQVFI